MYKLKSIITKEEFQVSELSRSELEDFMVDEFDVYIVTPEESCLIFYSNASDSFHYEKSHAIHQLNIK